MAGDPYWDNVVFLSGFEGGSVVDESPLAQTVTLSGSIAASSAQAKFGTQSLLRSGGSSTAVATVPDNAAFPQGTDPFTVECWLWFSSVPSVLGWGSLISHRDETNALGWVLGVYQNHVFFYAEDATNFGFADGAFSWSPNTWYHVAGDFDGTTYRVYVDGVVKASDAPGAIASIPNLSIPMAIGTSLNSSGSPVSGYINGHVDEARVTASVARYAGAFTAPTAAFPRTGSLDVTISEGVSFTEFTSPLGDLFIDTISEGIGINSLDVFAWGPTITDTFSASYLLNVIRAQPATASDQINMAPAISAFYGAVVLEQLRIVTTSVVNTHQQYTLTDLINVAERLIPGFDITMAETIGIAPLQQAQLAITVIENLGLLPVVSALATYNKTISEGIGIAETLTQFFGASLSDGIGIAEALSGNTGKPAAVSEGIGVAEAMTPQLILRVTAAETIGIEATDALNMILLGTLEDGVEISAAYLSPGEEITTWAMNTRSGAVSEYTNYAFNSFARFGHKYIAASETGLYELLGDDDDGTDIVSQIKSGYAQWGGAKFTMFKAAYLAVRGGGDYVLKITTGDDKTYSYAVSARDMRTTKINIGKGIRTRYFAFELISDGDDYDLESLEFVPISTDRRI